ncbi:MAG: 50S ribosomal protein L1 [Planctomycetota bacterium]|nr:MAG: 50S ribosomal protein L1 [Planctomycetota bacterium]
MAEDQDRQEEIRARAQATKSVGAAIEAAAAATESEKKSKGKKWNRRFKPSKRTKAARRARGVRTETHPIPQAIKMVKGFKNVNFDESMELHVKLGVNPKKSDQQVRGTFVFPHGVGRSKRVICFAEGPAAEEAREAGAMEVGGEELAKKIQEGWFDFDVVIAHPAMMRVVGRLGKLLGPKKLMPNPKEGSVTPRVGQAVKEFSGGKAKYRVDDTGNLHVVFGKKSFDEQKLIENLEAFLQHLQSVKPTTAKGTFIQKGYICSTMSPAVAIDVGPYAS